MDHDLKKPRKIKLSQFAQEWDISYRTAWQWVKDGKLPQGYSSEQLTNGTIRIIIN